MIFSGGLSPKLCFGLGVSLVIQSVGRLDGPLFGRSLVPSLDSFDRIMAKAEGFSSESGSRNPIGFTGNNTGCSVSNEGK